jgi:hypothetical protein
MVHKYSISFIFLILICFSCTDKTFDDNSNSDIVIKTGTVCGWCTLNDTLTIRGNNLRYVNYANCSTAKATVEKSGKLTSSELDTLLKLLDFDELKKLDLNSCNVCVDGCDDWISYESISQSQYIRFSVNDPKLKNIQSFVDELYRIKSKYSVNK